MTTPDPNRPDEATDATEVPGGSSEQSASVPAGETPPPSRPSWLAEPATDDSSPAPADEPSAAVAPDPGRPATTTPPSGTPAAGARTAGEPSEPADSARDDELTSTATRRQGFLGRTDEPRTTAATSSSSTTSTSSPAGTADRESGPAHAAPITPATAPARDEDAAAAPAGASTSADEAQLRERWGTDRERPSEAVLAGATEARPRSRAGAHWWSLLITLILGPVAWYLVADAGARLTLGENSPWQTGVVSPAALIELAAGLVVTVVVLLAARFSALGATVVGLIVLLVGTAFVAVPARAADLLGPVTDWLEGLNAFGGNVAHHLLQDGPSGRLALYGLTLFVVGLVSAGVRRAGRAEQRRREAYERRTARHGNNKA
ncbi:hypothetical protein [Georgenia alba]|uniref:Membrane protein YphA (DoxX/SURF4 family) n=1 Tax=Georgenia alba TaxID=2233858 RepID=A0ABW2Q8Z6_9MICO